MALIDLISGINWLSIVFFLVGLGLVIWEMCSPGFGLFGVFGIISFVVCIFVTADTLMEGVVLTAFFAILLLVMFGIFMVLVSKGKLPSKIVLHEATSKEEGFDGTASYDGYVGKTGTLATLCRPVGSADFDGEKLEVVTRGEFIGKGEAVEVISVEGNRVVVKAVEGSK